MTATELPLGTSLDNACCMAIVVARVGDLYEATVTPPHGRGEPWATPHPMPRDNVIAALRDRGCHQTDIGDAFYAADPEWQLRP